MDISTFSDVVDWVDKWLMDWCYYISEESRRVGLDEDESGQGPRSGD